MYIFEDLGYGGVIKDSSNGDERFVQGDDYSIVVEELDNCKTKKQRQEYLENYFI